MKQLKIFSLVILITTVVTNVQAQNRGTQIKADFNNLKAKLKMDDKRFRDFKQKLALFNDSITQQMNKPGLSSDERRNKVELIQINRNIHLRKTLTKVEYATFAEFEKGIRQSSLQRQRLRGN